MNRKILLLSLYCLLLFVACRPDETPTPAATPTSPVLDEATATSPATAPPTQAVVATAPPTIAPTATNVPAGDLTICLGAEPESLYLYGTAMYAADVVRELIYDGPIDSRAYDFQPIILEKLPSLADGDATLSQVAVTPGQMVVDHNGNVVALREGVVVHPAGCTQSDCIIAYDGESPLNMDQLTADFKLLPDLKWSDGQPLTAADSLFSFSLAQTAQAKFGERIGYQGVRPERNIDPTPRTASYTAPDPLTVRWTGLPGYLDPYYRTNFYLPLPEHQLREIPPDQLPTSEIASRRPLGWGPYVLDEWIPGEQIVASRNPNYFRAAEGLPYFDRVIVRFLLGDSAAYLAELAAGRCDIVTADAIGSDLTPALDLQAQGLAQVQAITNPVWEHLDFGINSDEALLRPDFFEDVRLRQAVAHCINRQRLADELTFGLSPLFDAYIPPDHPLYAQAQLTHYGYDVPAGIALLESMGWLDSDGDGRREAHNVAGIANDTPLSLTLQITNSDFRQQLAEMVSQDLAQCGLTVTPVVSASPDLFFANEADGLVFGRRFDLVAFAWFTDANPPCHLFLTSQIPTVETNWQGFNNSGYSNPDYDAACQAARAALPGTAAYMDNELTALQIFNRDLPVLPLLLRWRAAVSRPELIGLAPDPTHRPESWNIESLREPHDN